MPNYSPIREKIALLKFSWFLNLLAISIFILLVFNALTKVDFAWDNLAYHLPFAARQAGLFTLEEFKLAPGLEVLYQGVPQFAEILQGYLWRITGWITATNLVSLGGLLAFVALSATRLKLRFWQLTLLSLSVPLILIQSIASYNDLINGCLIAMGIVGLFASVERDQYTLKNYFWAMFPVMLAANVKYQALPVVVFYAIIMIAMFLWSARKNLFSGKKPTGHFYKFIVFTVLLGLIGGFTLMKNTYLYRNPVHPLSMHLGSIRLGSSASQMDYDVPLSEELKDVPRFSIYLISLSELYLWTDNTGQLWGIGGMPGNLQDNIFFKLGGFFVANLVLWLMFLFVVLLYKRDRKMVFYSVFLLASFLFAGFLPSSGLLRYWLFLPLIFILVVLLVYEKVDDGQKMTKLLFNLLQLAIFCFVVYQNHNIFIPGKSLNQTVTNEVNYANLQSAYHLDFKSPVCIVHKRDNRQAFLYKLANTSLSIQDARITAECIYENILVLDGSQ